MAAQSSLSHWSTVRPGAVAHSTGQTSTTGRSQMTIPPEWTPRCRGNPSRQLASSRTGAGISPGDTRAVSAREWRASTVRDHASIVPSACPSALPASRRAERGR